LNVAFTEKPPDGYPPSLIPAGGAHGESPILAYSRGGPSARAGGMVPM
jgi:hypothetical protein